MQRLCVSRVERESAASARVCLFVLLGSLLYKNTNTLSTPFRTPDPALVGQKATADPPLPAPVPVTPAIVHRAPDPTSAPSERVNGTGNAPPLPESRLRIQGPSREASIDEDGDEGDDRRVRDLKRRASSPEASRDRDAGPDARPAKRPALEPRSPPPEGERLWEPGMPKPLALRPLRRSPAPDERDFPPRSVHADRGATEALPIASSSFPTGRVPRSALIGFCHMLIADLNSPGMVFSGKRVLERRAFYSA